MPRLQITLLGQTAKGEEVMTVVALTDAQVNAVLYALEHFINRTETCPPILNAMRRAKEEITEACRNSA
jgi:hypothetical protein